MQDSIRHLSPSSILGHKCSSLANCSPPRRVTVCQVRFTFELLCALQPGTSIMALHGKCKHLRRTQIYMDFLRKPAAALLATDIAARGLDFPSVDWVIQVSVLLLAHAGWQPFSTLRSLAIVLRLRALYMHTCLRAYMTSCLVQYCHSSARRVSPKKESSVRIPATTVSRLGGLAKFQRNSSEISDMHPCLLGWCVALR